MASQRQRSDARPAPVPSALPSPIRSQATPAQQHAGQGHPKTLIFLADAGAGHRTTAISLLSYLPDWAVPGAHLVNPCREVLTKGGLTDRLIFGSFEWLYNLLYSRFDWVGRIWPWLANLFVAITDQRRDKVDLLLRQYLREERPDLTVVVTPLLCCNILRQARFLSLRSLVIMTDKEEIIAGTWIPEHADSFAAFSAAALARARALGAERTWLLSGPVLRPGFFSRDPDFCQRLARRLKLDPTRACVLVLFGGHPPPKMLSIAKALAEVDRPIEVLFLCGHGERVRSQLDRLDTPYPMRAFGFTRRVDHLMELADVMIGKPGGGSAFEAVAKGAGVLLELNASTLPHERANADSIAAQGFGTTFESEAELPAALCALLDQRQGLDKRPDPPFRSDLEIREVLDSLYGEIAGSCISQENAIRKREPASGS